ncbi:hypothetical protein KEM48_000374 [Puccinia striiformis f. sp. tritici PST-130]|nr:hypothetical protein KEM48_000374 [Puccinia striiformis f. sp. tritici PST-130]
MQAMNSVQAAFSIGAQLLSIPSGTIKPGTVNVDLLGESDSHFKIRKEHLVRRLRNKYGDQYGLPQATVMGAGKDHHKLVQVMKPNSTVKNSASLQKTAPGLDLNLYLHAPNAIRTTLPRKQIE